MAEERIVEVTQPDGATHTHTTVYQDRPATGGGGGWLIGLVLVIALIVGGYFLLQMQDSRSTRDDAIAQAASDVGTAAKQIGNAAKDATDGK
ncbi:MAG: hypothetical protein V4521_11135 [Pseudomonadota bacterium]